MLSCASNAPNPANNRSTAGEASESDTHSTTPVAGVPRAPTILRGTGVFASPPPATPATPPSTEEGFQLGFADTDLATVIATVIGEGLNQPYLIDPQVKGTLTLQATRPLAREELLPALEAALRVQGFAIVDVNGVLNVVPLKEASRRVTGIRAPGAAAQGFAVEIVPLEFVSADEMQKVLQPFAPDGSILRVDTARNMLLLAGTSQELKTLREVITTFDVDWLAGTSFAIHPLQYVDAKTIAGELEQVFAGPNAPIAGMVRFVPLTRLNSLMVVTPQPKYLDTVAEWIQRFDLGTAAPGRRIYVYEVQNGKADELANSLNRVLSLSGGGGPESSSSLSSGSATRGPTTPPPRAEAPASYSGGDNAMRLVTNDENNALLILATPTEFAMVEAALKRLDLPPLQVMIEASLAEVTLTDELRYGLQWAYQSSEGPIVLSEAANGSINQQFPGFSYLYTGSRSIRGVLNSIESLTNVRVLSAPKLLVLNNREAQLQIGDQVPVTTQSAVSTNASSAPIVNSVQFRDTGVILRVTPRVNRNGLVFLDIAQEVSDVVPTTSSGIDSPTIQQRKISSTISVHDGDTIALGGLIRESKGKSGGGIPFLRRIPLFGDLFGSTNRTSRRTELIVLITPRVIRDGDDATRMTQDLREQFRRLRREVPIWKKPPATPVAPAATPAPVAAPVAAPTAPAVPASP